jgi:hypothetical protein
MAKRRKSGTSYPNNHGMEARTKVCGVSLNIKIISEKKQDKHLASELLLMYSTYTPDSNPPHTVQTSLPVTSVVSIVYRLRLSNDHRYLADKTKAPPLSARTEVALTRPGLTVFTCVTRELFTLLFFAKPRYMVSPAFTLSRWLDEKADSPLPQSPLKTHSPHPAPPISGSAERPPR